MSERILNILRGAGSVLDILPAELPKQSDFDRELDQFLNDRPSSFESFLMDLRRSMISQLDTLPEDERSILQRKLKPGYRFDYEQQIGLGVEPRSKDDHQLEFSFADS